MRVKCRNEAVQTSKYLKRDENYSHISLKSTNDRVLRDFRLVSLLITACTVFGAYNAVTREFKRRKISNGKESTVIFR
jgi:hypothetical protein